MSKCILNALSEVVLYECSVGGLKMDRVTE